MAERSKIGPPSFFRKPVVGEIEEHANAITDPQVDHVDESWNNEDCKMGEGRIGGKVIERIRGKLSVKTHENSKQTQKNECPSFFSPHRRVGLGHQYLLS